MTVPAAVVIAIIFSTALVPVMAATNAVQAAIERFWAQEKVPTLKAFGREKLGPAALKAFHAGIAQCRNEVRGELAERIGIVLVLDAEGTAAEVIVLEATPLQRCVAKFMSKMKYPTPPEIPFYYPLFKDSRVPPNTLLERTLER